jgi:hypothetical protein
MCHVALNEEYTFVLCCWDLVPGFGRYFFRHHVQIALGLCMIERIPGLLMRIWWRHDNVILCSTLLTSVAVNEWSSWLGFHFVIDRVHSYLCVVRAIILWAIFYKTPIMPVCAVSDCNNSTNINRKRKGVPDNSKVTVTKVSSCTEYYYVIIIIAIIVCSTDYTIICLSETWLNYLCLWSQFFSCIVYCVSLWQGGFHCMEFCNFYWRQQALVYSAKVFSLVSKSFLSSNPL